MLYLYSLTLLIMLGLVILITRDLFAHNALSLLAWVMAFFSLVNCGYRIDENSPAYLVLVIGILAFQFFFLFSAGSRKEHEAHGHEALFSLDNENLKKILVIEVLVVAVVFACFLTQVPQVEQITTLLTTMKSGDSDSALKMPSWMGYAENIIEGFSIAILFSYFKCDETIRRQNAKLVVLQVILGLACCFLKLSRNGFLWYLLPLVAVFVKGKKLSFRQCVYVLLVGSVAFLVIFFGFAWLKYGYRYSTFNFGELFSDQFISYLASPLVCFQLFFDSYQPSGTFSNTLRFFSAFNVALGLGDGANELVQQFIYIANGVSSNVYTMFQYYCDDFGVVYSIIMSAILGLMSGFCYKRENVDALFGYLSCLLLYPAFMQFFQDQYFSLASTWLQLLFVGLIVFRTKLVLRRVEAEQVNFSRELKC